MPQPLWTLKNVRLGEPRGNLRLCDITMSILPGVTGVVGPSGAGKSSLLELLVGYLVPDQGVIDCQIGREEELPVYWVPQGDGLWPRWTVRDHVARVWRGADRISVGTSDRDAQDRLLSEFDLTAVAHRFPSTLSQGERSRVAIARGIATRATVLVMDEPFSTVSASRARDYWRALRNWRPPGSSLVFATHAYDAVIREAEHVVCLSEGQVRYAGGVAELYEKPPSRELAECLGPTNWFAAGEARQWLDGVDADVMSIRPEQVVPMRVPESRLQVGAITSAGGLTEMTVERSDDGARRIILHRSANCGFHGGERVLFRVLSVCLLFILWGCGSPRHAPTLAVDLEQHWSMPAAGGKIPAPREIQIASDGEAYVLDTAGRILVFGTDGTLVRKWDMPAHDVGNPEGLCLLADGRLVIADTHYHRLVFFTRNGKLVGITGKRGTGPGEFIYPVSVVEDDKGILYVAEYGGNDRVQRFSATGAYLGEFGGFGTEPGEFQRPGGMAWLDGKIYVADAINNRIQVFSDAGTYLQEIGGPSSSWSLQYPYDVTVGAHGRLYVIEYGAGRLTAMGPQGELFGRWGANGTGRAELATPWGLAADKQQRLLIADTGNRRIVELRLP